MKPHLFYWPGSLRQESLTTRLLHDLANRVGLRASADMVHARDLDWALYCQDREQLPVLRDPVLGLYARLAQCDAIVLASPEHNAQPSACLKNAVDWLSRVPMLRPELPEALRNKPLLLCSASTGWSGGAVALQSARALMAYVGALVLPDTITIPYADQAWNGSAYELDPWYDERIESGLANLLQLASVRGQRSV